MNLYNLNNKKITNDLVNDKKNLGKNEENKINSVERETLQTPREINSAPRIHETRRDVREFTSEHEVNKQGNQYFTSLTNSNTDENTVHIIYYFTNHGFSSMNKHERNKAVNQDEISKSPESWQRAEMFNAVLSAELRKHQIKKELIVFKGVDKTRLEMMVGGVNYKFNDIESRLVGRVIRDRGFISTAVIKEKAFGNKPFLLEITVPPGARAAYVAAVSSCKRECELLLDRDQSMVITGTRKTGYQTIIECSLLPKSEPKLNSGDAQRVFTPSDDAKIKEALTHLYW